MKILDTNWDAVKAQFIFNFRAAPTDSTVIQKLPEIRQKDNDTVNQYFSECAKIILELNENPDITGLLMNLQLIQATF